MTARYWIAQHVADIFRNEPHNVGVVVTTGGSVAAHFFGEDDDLRLDGRKLKKLPYPDVYRQWVEYWRKGLSDVDSLVRDTRGHYRLIPAGEVTDLGDAPAVEVSRFLYTALVSEGGIGEALSDAEIVENPSVQLEKEVAEAFSQRALIATEGADIFVPHPIRRRANVIGATITHTPAFSQLNGHLCVMETADLTSQRRAQSRDHAGFIAYMFRDIRDREPASERFAIVRVTDADRAHGEVEYALSALKNEAEIIDWFKQDQRAEFIETRGRVAHE